MAAFIAFLLISLLTLHLNHAWLSHSRPRFVRSHPERSNLKMIFDFIRKRSEEGIAQVQNIASKTFEGKLVEALSDSASYIKQRNEIDLENVNKIFEGLAKSRDRLLGGISNAFLVEDAGIEAILEKLEEVLLQADIGTATTQTILEDLRSYARTTKINPDDVTSIVRERLIEALTPANTKIGINFSSKAPTVIFVIGANGMGKTTTIGKLAARFRREVNATVLLAACDTYRAAAPEQLNEWAKRADVAMEIPKESERGGSPISVLSRALKRAADEQFDIIIVDTSGRLTNNFNLVQELIDMKNTIQNFNKDAPHETLLVVDGSLGRNAVDQAQLWRKYVGVSGLVVTKMDGTARGGFIVPVIKDMGLPVKFIGVGEQIEDLRDFNPTTFVDALLGNNAENLQQIKARADKILSSTGNRTKT